MQKRTLAGPRGPHNRNRISWLNGEGYAIEDFKGGEGFVDSFGFEYVHSVGQVGKKLFESTDE
jgi:hypothetical protein